MIWYSFSTLSEQYANKKNKVYMLVFLEHFFHDFS